MPVFLALCTTLLWGTTDFLGGTASRRLPAAVVVGVSQAIALLALLPAVVLLGARPDHLYAGVAAGLCGSVALGAFYSALASGTMGVVAPLASLGAVLPVGVGLARGETPSSVQVVGIVIAVVGVVLASGPELSGGTSVRPVVLASAAAVGFGLVSVLVAEGSKGPQGAFVVTLTVMRVTILVPMALALLVVSRRGYRTGLVRQDLRLMAVIGVGDVGANATYAIASRGGLLSVVAVLASLYPVVTVLLARQVHGERLRRVQVLGVLGTLGGVALLAAG